MGEIDLPDSLSQATLALESAAGLFGYQRWSTAEAAAASGRQIRPAKRDELRYLDSSAKRSDVELDPAEASMHELLTVLRREKPDAASELSKRWESANLEFQSLCEQCPEPNEEFVENRLNEKLNDFVADIEAEIDLLKEQVLFLKETLSKLSDENIDQGPELEFKLEHIEQMIDDEKKCLHGSSLSELKEESRALENELDEARQRSENSNCQELHDLTRQLDQAQSAFNAIQSRNGSQVEQAGAIRHAIRSIVQRRLESKQPFAIVLSVLCDNQGVMPLEEFKTKVGDLLESKSEVVSLLYSLVGQGLIEIDRTIGKGIVKSCIQLM